MSIRRAVIAVGLACAAAGLSGCLGEASSASHRTVHRSELVSLSPPGSTSERVTGGTAAMRARARAILTGMPGTAIDAVRFGRAPATFSRFGGLALPAWVYVTVAGPDQRRTTSPFPELRTSGSLWQAGVFEEAYLASPPAGQPRVRGTAEAISSPAGVRPISSGTAVTEHYAGPAPGDAVIRDRVVEAAADANFQVVSIRLIHPHRPAATIILRVLSHARFAQRYEELVRRFAHLRERLGGLQWEVIDRCGGPVAVESAGSWINPRWLCPSPFILGIAPTASECRKLARAMPAC